MTAGPWSARLRAHRGDQESAVRLHRALAPEAEREVPRAHCTLTLSPDGNVLLDIRTRDTGALRAALNTYLGWIDLAEATERVGHVAPAVRVPAPEALK
ncbi:MAG: hypothetical protein L3K17_07760 [Thermoplasmata archaeon]|nr:hypothetical protein [Thermoplasmata archaeon]